MDAALLKACSDASLKPAIVQQFVEAVGAEDPLTVTVKSGDRLILVPRPQSPTEAMELVRKYLGRAQVRVGLTQYPAGIGITSIGEQQLGIIEPCDNLKMGTAMFAKIMRIVSRSFAGSKDENRAAHVFDAAVEAWRSGSFEGLSVFSAPDPKPMPAPETVDGQDDGEASKVVAADPGEQPVQEQDPGRAGIRIDLTRIGGQK